MPNEAFWAHNPVTLITSALLYNYCNLNSLIIPKRNSACMNYSLLILSSFSIWQPPVSFLSLYICLIRMLHITRISFLFLVGFGLFYPALCFRVYSIMLIRTLFFSWVYKLFFVCITMCALSIHMLMYTG